MDRLTSFKVFVKAAEMGSFSATADALQMSPQLVGRHIQELEQRLGVRLLNRTTRRQSLTDFGQKFYERAHNILAEIESAENLAAETRAVPSGLLKISAPVSFGMHVLSTHLPEYMKRFPQVQVDLRLSNRLVDLTDEGFDVAFRVGELNDSRLVARSLAPYQLILCASPRYIAMSPPLVTPADLINHTCLGYSLTELRNHWTFEGTEGRIVVPISSRLMVDHGEPLLHAALKDMGVLLQPVEIVSQALSNGDLVALLPDYKVPGRPMHIVYTPDHRLTPKLRSFLDFSVDLFGISNKEMINI